MTERYTPYQLFQDRAFSEASATRSYAYTADVYKCPFSQGVPAYMADSMEKKQFHDSASVSGCCNQPNTPFTKNPQYTAAGEYRPPTPTNCGSRVTGGGCNALEIYATSGSASFCADSALPVEVRIRCPKMCESAMRINQGEVIEGTNGSWSALYAEDQDSFLVQYTPLASVYQSHYNNCSGVTSYSEKICDDFTIEFQLSAGLNSPNGCRCDCCGTNGYYSPPSGSVYSDAPATTYENTVQWGSAYVNGACYDGWLNAAAIYFDGSGGSISWNTEPGYESDGSSRRVRGVPGILGGNSTPACCGITLQLEGYDGCGTTRRAVTTLARKPPSPSWNPSGDTMEVGQSYTVRLIGACNKSSLASLTFDSENVDTTNWGSVSYATDGELRRNINTAILSTSFASKGCCGKGEIAAAYNDGCNNTGSHQWHVRNPPSTGSDVVGTVFKAQDVGGGNWRIYYASLHCSGAEGFTWSQYSGTNFASADLCVAFMSDPANLSGACGSSTYCPSAGLCCAYVNNALTRNSFRCAIFCVNNTAWSTSPKCCTLPFEENGAWIQQVSSTCCPN